MLPLITVHGIQFNAQLDAPNLPNEHNMKTLKNNTRVEIRKSNHPNWSEEYSRSNFYLIFYNALFVPFTTIKSKKWLRFSLLEIPKPLDYY